MKTVVLLVLALLLVGGSLALGILAGPFSKEQAAAVSADPHFFNALGYRLAQEGNPVQAQAAFAHAVALDPSYENARSNLATIAFQHQEYLTATEHLRVLVAQHPGNEDYRFDLAQNLVHQARFVDSDVAKLTEAAAIFESLGGYPHAAENARIVRAVVVGSPLA